MAAPFDLARLQSSGLFAALDYHEELGSSSDRALELAARDELPLPLLVLTERQTAGRGRGTNRWIANEGGLTFSLVLAAPTEALPQSRWPEVALTAGLAVCEALQTLAPRAPLQVKWPNDVFLSGRKVCGILSESVPGWRDRLVLGIGINVNNRREPEMEHSEQNVSPLRGAISLIEHDRVPRDRTAVLIEVLDRFELRWRELLEGNFAGLAASYRGRCFLTGKCVTIEQPGGQAASGMCQGIDDYGALMLATEIGPRRIIAGSVARWE